MREDEVPQDAENSTYGGSRKLLYARSGDGNFVGVKSAGWDVEAEATRMALDLLKSQCDDSWERAQRGVSAPLEYYMYYRRMDVALLAQTAGMARWRVRRHLKPQVFAKLPARILWRYAEALELPVDQLRALPETPLS
ncbi:MAG: hypothetical protein HKN19_06130 [Halioglobus sp.]|nr:hypothetical protein [Halioglobus sp.]